MVEYINPIHKDPNIIFLFRVKEDEFKYVRKKSCLIYSSQEAC